MSGPPHLTSLNNDVLIYLMAFLNPPEILRMRQTCRRITTLSKLHVIWSHAHSIHVLNPGYPSPPTAYTSISTPELERRTCHAFRLAGNWLTGSCTPTRVTFIDGTAGTSVSDIRFLPKYPGMLLTISKSVWSEITLWDVAMSTPQKCFEWSSRGSIFNGFSVNADATSEAILAVSLLEGGESRIEFLTLYQEDNGLPQMKSISVLRTSARPVSLQGDLLATSNDLNETTVWNWKASTCAVLVHPFDEGGMIQHDHCIQVMFTYQSILVVRARSIHLFPDPALRNMDDNPLRYEPVARHSFGWVDGVSVCLQPDTLLASSCSDRIHKPLMILIRAESDDPWASEIHNLELFTLQPNPDFKQKLTEHSDDRVQTMNISEPFELADPSSVSPYTFPPMKKANVRSVRGSLRCTDLFLGRYGTAIWIQPRDRAVAGLVWTGDHTLPAHVAASSNSHESVMAAVFPGPLAPDLGEREGTFAVNSMAVYSNPLDNWTSIDYDEELGRIALSSSFGRITILQL